MTVKKRLIHIFRYTRAELEGIAKIAEEHDLLVISDEVYEWHIYPGKEMIRFGKHLENFCTLLQL